jgi:hypothetical protein
LLQSPIVSQEWRARFQAAVSSKSNEKLALAFHEMPAEKRDIWALILSHWKRNNIDKQSLTMLSLEFLQSRQNFSSTMVDVNKVKLSDEMFKIELEFWERFLQC